MRATCTRACSPKNGQGTLSRCFVRPRTQRTCSYTSRRWFGGSPSMCLGRAFGCYAQTSVPNMLCRDVARITSWQHSAHSWRTTQRFLMSRAHHIRMHSARSKALCSVRQDTASPTHAGPSLAKWHGALLRKGHAISTTAAPYGGRTGQRAQQ